MLGIVSLAWGILAMIGMAIGFFPCVGGLHWINIFFAVGGAVTGIVAIFSSPQGGSRSGIIGTTLCMVAGIVGMVRLVIEGGP